MSLSFIRGLVAAVNPCGFILLPTYLMFFLGLVFVIWIVVLDGIFTVLTS